MSETIPLNNRWEEPKVTLTIHTEQRSILSIGGPNPVEVHLCSDDLRRAFNRAGQIFNSYQDPRIIGWGIVDTDNFGRDYPDEKWIARSIRTEDEAKKMLEAIQEKYPEHASRFQIIADDNYILAPRFEP